jgi:hypothetical protein
VKAVRWLILLWPGIISAQWSFDFEENFPNRWEQFPESRWEISSESPLNGLFSLHHSYDNPSSGEDMAYVNLNYPVLDSALIFSFRIKHAYNPSSGNNWQVYFLSQQGNQLINAFVFGVNFKGSDDMIKLWQVVEGETSEIVNTEIDYEEYIGRSNAPQFVIRREPSGLWKVSGDIEGQGGALILVGEGEELIRSEGKFLGLRYCYSSAQDRKLWLDDVLANGIFYEDNEPPKLDSIIMAGLNSLQLCFSENIVVESNSYFQWNGLSAHSVSISSNKIQLFFSEKFPNREEQHLVISGISDIEGNRMNDTLYPFMQNLVEYGEIVMNEIMSDPDPEVYLPACEYIELYNRSDFMLEISGWTMKVNSKSYTIGSGIISPGEYLLLTSENLDCSFDGISRSKVFSSSTSLSNSGAELKLFDQYHRLIHSAAYREMSFYSQMKGDGGWSLERIDPDRSCGGPGNWSVSLDDSGGTPGIKNSVYFTSKDLTIPELKYVGIADTNTIVIHFSESIFLAEETDSHFSTINLGNAIPIFHTSPLVSDRIELHLQEVMNDETNYLINIGEVSDCEGNIMQESIVKFALPDFPKPNAILINELMYDAFVGQQEYLELYNHSDRFMDLKDLKYGVRSVGNSMGSFSWISEDSHLLPPWDYVVLTKNDLALREDWGLDYSVDVVELSSWKTMPNGAGSIILLNRSDIAMESVAYNDSMHHKLLMDPSGVSLERMSGGTGISHWTSAAASSNYGTPGTHNSQWISESSEQLKTVVNPRVFTPDIDGYEDVAEIILTGTSPGSVISIYVTDLNGKEVIKLIENGISGSDDRYFWDGHDMNHMLVLPGIYVIHIRIAGTMGEKVDRHCCAVAYR